MLPHVSSSLQHGSRLSYFCAAHEEVPVDVAADEVAVCATATDATEAMSRALYSISAMVSESGLTKDYE